MNGRAMGWLAVVGGLVAINFAYLSDLWIRDAPCIWLGPKSGALIVASLVVTLAGAWLLSRRPSGRS